jgi:K+-transporting ATPase ATPase B chain
MSKNNKTTMSAEILRNAVRDSFLKLNPKSMIKNPVMFVVEVGMVVTLVLTFFPNALEHGSSLYNGIITGILFITVLFANFAEAVAEGRGKAQADSMKKTRKDTKAKLVSGSKVTVVNASDVKKGDIVLV